MATAVGIHVGFPPIPYRKGSDILTDYLVLLVLERGREGESKDRCEGYGVLRGCSELCWLDTCLAL
jgi:hypothetical protein